MPTVRTAIRRLHFHRKLMLAFAAVLLPVLMLLCVDFVSNLRGTQDTILEAQNMTAQAVAVQVAESFDAAIDLGWAMANDPLVRTMDPRQLDAHLQRLTENDPRYDAIGVYDATGLNRGWGVPDEPAEPRLRIGDRPYFQRVMATNAPVVSHVVELRRPARKAVIVSVPIRGDGGRPVGLVNIILHTDRLEQRYLATRIHSGQEILLVDPTGRLALHTGAPELEFERSDVFSTFGPLQAALRGTPVQLDRFTSPLNQEASLGAFVPIPKYRWVVGVTAPREVALAPLYASLRAKVAAFLGILLLSGMLAALLARLHARPVRQLQWLAHSLGRGAMEQRVHIRTGDEMEELGAAFNQMAEQISHRQREVDTLRTQAEHQASQLAAIIASVQDAIFLASPDGRLSDANPAGLRLLGGEGRSRLGQSLEEFRQRYDIRHADGHPMTPGELPLQRALCGEAFSDVELRLRDAEGVERLFSVNGAPVKDAAGRIVLGEIVFHDISERKRTEEERLQLLEREQALARIGQALVREMELERITHVASEQSLNALGADAVGLWLASPEHQRLTLVASHGLAQEVRELLREVPFGTSLLTAQAARKETLQVIEDVEARDTPPLSRTLARKEGFRGAVAVPLHSRGRLVGVMTCYSYAPRQFSARELEFHTTVGQLFAVAIEKARLFQEVREALRLREEFMSAAAHELRTPVTTIQTWADILTRLEGNSERQRKGLAAIARSTRRMTRLVEHLFTAVWMAPGLPKLERDRFDLRDLVEERIEGILRTTEHPIHFEADDAPVIDADRQRMGEVVAHLLENAIRYSPPDGPIEVRLACTGNEAVVSVRDHGPGIPPERQPHVFEPLYEPVPPGATGYVGVVGLGLHLSWQIIEAHGGRIWLESTPGQGTVFSFSLPRVGTDAPRRTRGRAPTRASVQRAS